MGLPIHLRRGLRGEQLAASYLREKNYEILAANYSTKLGETDIVALSPDNIMCFIEVKTRSPGQMFSPAEAVDSKKQENLKTNAAAYSKRMKITQEIRFDIIEVILHDMFTADINHIVNAF